MKKLLTFIGIAVVLVACRKKELDKMDGPSLQDINGQFSVITTLEASKDSVDFSTSETVYFTAEFSKTIAWKLDIIGLTSGAVKTIEGTGNALTESVTLWAGSTTSLPLFKSENCKVQLTFTGETDTLVDYVKVIQPKANAGYVVADFEAGFNSGWTYFIQQGADMDFQVKSDITAPQGNAYYNLAGTVDWDWLIGLVNFKATAGGNPTFPLNSNPNNVYFNVMVWGDGSLTNSLVLFQFEEDENGDGTFTAASEDQYAVEIPVNWSGWKLISFKYSDIPCLVNGQPAAPNGDGVHNSNKIKQVNMLHLANPSSGYAKAKLDYIIFTENGPLNP